MFLVQIANMCLVLVFVMYLVNKDVVVSTNIFLSWLSRGILQLQHLSSNSWGRGKGSSFRDLQVDKHQSGSCGFIYCPELVFCLLSAPLGSLCLPGACIRVVEFQKGILKRTWFAFCPVVPICVSWKCKEQHCSGAKVNSGICR